MKVTDSCSCPLTRCGINDVEPSDSACNQRGVSSPEEAERGGVRDEEVILIIIHTRNNIRYRRIKS
jgi:hypothetical protein